MNIPPRIQDFLEEASLIEFGPRAHRHVHIHFRLCGSSRSKSQLNLENTHLMSISISQVKESGAEGRTLAFSRVLVAVWQLDTTKYFIDLIFLLVGGG